MALSGPLKSKLEEANTYAKDKDNIESVYKALCLYNYIYKHSYLAHLEFNDYSYIKTQHHLLDSRLRVLRDKMEEEAKTLAKNSYNYTSLIEASKIFDTLSKTAYYLSSDKENLSLVKLKDEKYSNYSYECKQAAEKLNLQKQKPNDKTTQVSQRGSIDPELSSKIFTIIFIIVIGIFYFMFIYDSGPKWSELSDKEKANAEWAYEVKQFQKEYEKNNKKK